MCLNVPSMTELYWKCPLSINRRAGCKSNASRATCCAYVSDVAMACPAGDLLVFL